MARGAAEAVAQPAETRGPWRVYKLPGRVWIVGRVDSNFYMQRNNKAAAQRVCDESNANYRDDLVRKAAPDMLAALKQIRSLLMANNRGPLCAIEDELVPLDAAIAKAEGR